jgi:hypothetical protein
VKTTRKCFCLTMSFSLLFQTHGLYELLDSPICSFDMVRLYNLMKATAHFSWSLPLKVVEYCTG